MVPKGCAEDEDDVLFKAKKILMKVRKLCKLFRGCTDECVLSRITRILYNLVVRCVQWC